MNDDFSDFLKHMDSVLGIENGQNINKEGLELIKTVKSKKIPKVVSREFLNSYQSGIFRGEVIKHMGFVLLTEEFIKNLANYIGDKKCLEIMAGKGAISKELQDRNISIIATDNYSWRERLLLYDTWLDVENLDCLEAIQKYGKDVDYIICSWIPYGDPIGYKALKLMNEVNPDCKMIVIGEDEGGCTADDSFFESCDYIHESGKNGISDIEGLITWHSIHDYVSVVKFKK